MTETKTKHKVNSLGQQELDKAAEQFDAFDKNIKEMTLDRMNMAPKDDAEPQTKLSQKEIEKSKDIYLKPSRAIGCRHPFDEKYRKDWEFYSEYVQFIAENREILGETIELWTKKFRGIAAEFWQVPVNKPVWGPRYLAERIKGCSYHRLSTRQDMVTSSDGMGQYYGQMVVDNVIQRLDAIPANNRKSIFMGASSF